jgi:hypothetical protein
MPARNNLCNTATELQRSSRTQAGPVALADLDRCNGTATVVKRARHQPTMDERRQRKQAMSGTERSRRSRERKREREAAEGGAKRASFREEARVSMQQQAIRAGVERHELHRGWRDREGRWHGILEVIFDDIAPDPALEDERQQQAEADGTWPTFTVNPDAAPQIPSAEGER